MDDPSNRMQGDKLHDDDDEIFLNNADPFSGDCRLNSGLEKSPHHVGS